MHFKTVIIIIIIIKNERLIHSITLTSSSE